MFYRLLGMIVWNGGKLFLRRKYGSAYVPKPLVAGGILAIVAGVAILASRPRRRRSRGSPCWTGTGASMVYTLIGKAVVKGAKVFLRRRYGPTRTPKPVLAGGAVALGAGLALIVLRARD